MRILLAERETRDEFHERLRRSSIAYLLAILPPAPPHEVVLAVMASRKTARSVVAAHPEVSGPVELDCRYVAVLTTSFVDELLKAWPEATFVHVDPDSEMVVALVRELRR